MPIMPSEFDNPDKQASTKGPGDSRPEGGGSVGEGGEQQQEEEKLDKIAESEKEKIARLEKELATLKTLNNVAKKKPKRQPGKQNHAGLTDHVIWIHGSLQRNKKTGSRLTNTEIMNAISTAEVSGLNQNAKGLPGTHPAMIPRHADHSLRQALVAKLFAQGVFFWLYVNASYSIRERSFYFFFRWAPAPSDPKR